MSSDFTKEEKKLLQAKDPADYIDKSLKCDIPSGRKAFISRQWLKRSGYNSSDLEYSRNRHPYWKAKKSEGSAERVSHRFSKHDYSKGKKIIWDEQSIKKFIELNKKDKKGNYVYKDWELAKQFKSTIATIQHMRRKYNMCVRIISSKFGKVTSKRLLDHIKLGEGALREMTKKS